MLLLTPSHWTGGSPIAGLSPGTLLLLTLTTRPEAFMGPAEVLAALKELPRSP